VTRLSRITSGARFGGIGTSRTTQTAEGQITVLAYPAPSHQAAGREAIRMVPHMQRLVGLSEPTKSRRCR
jgi:hypothetical protein